MCTVRDIGEMMQKMSFVVNRSNRLSFIKTLVKSKLLHRIIYSQVHIKVLTYLLSAVAEQVLVHRLVAVLVVELGGHDVAVAGEGQELCLDVTVRPPEPLLGPHPGLLPYILASSWVTSECRGPVDNPGSLASIGGLATISDSSCRHSVSPDVWLLCLCVPRRQVGNW